MGQRLKSHSHGERRDLASAHIVDLAQGGAHLIVYGARRAPRDGEWSRRSCSKGENRASPEAGHHRAEGETTRRGYR